MCRTIRQDFSRTSKSFILKQLNNFFKGHDKKKNGEKEEKTGL
jgi:hypothetical protein